MPRAAAAPLVLNGTLTVDNNPDATSTTMNADGSMTTSVAVAGQLGTLGRVHGIWNETMDAYGDYEGPDELILRAQRDRSPSGSTTRTRNQCARSRRISYQHAQVVLGGTGAYAKESESGSIEVTTNAARTQIVSLTLMTRNT